MFLIKACYAYFGCIQFIENVGQERFSLRERGCVGYSEMIDKIVNE